MADAIDVKVFTRICYDTCPDESIAKDLTEQKPTAIYSISIVPLSNVGSGQYKLIMVYSQ
jgi:hypothetical protein